MRGVFTILALFIATAAATAQPLDIVEPESVGMSSTHLKYADIVIEKAIAEEYIPGAVLAVVKDGKMAYLKAYGSKSTTPNVEPMDVNTIFDIASCTKPISTALSAMILIERGQLSLRDNLDTYFPDINKNKSYNGRRCTIKVKNLLTHTTGFTSYVAPATLEAKYKKANKEAMIKYIKSEPLRYETGKDFKYSCLNYITLQYIIEQITGQSLREFANENIFDRLEMNETDYMPTEWADPSRIAATEVYSRDSVSRGVVHDPLAYNVNNGVSGNAGVFSTASDLAIVAAMILGDGTYNGKTILSPLTVDAMCRIPSDLSSLGRSLGWDVSSAYSSNIGDIFGASSFGHTGFTGCSMTLDREHDIAVILLTNGIHSSKYQSKEMISLRSRVANCVAASVGH